MARRGMHNRIAHTLYYPIRLLIIDAPLREGENSYPLPFYDT
jgi:hypothetical protein